MAPVHLLSQEHIILSIDYFGQLCKRIGMPVLCQMDYKLRVCANHGILILTGVAVSKGSE